MAGTKQKRSGASSKPTDENVPVGVCASLPFSCCPACHLEICAVCGVCFVVWNDICCLEGETYLIKHPDLFAQEYVGTLRWASDLQLPKLEKSAAAKTGSLESWHAFCDTRLRGTSLYLERDNQIQLSTPHLIDGKPVLGCISPPTRSVVLCMNILNNSFY